MSRFERKPVLIGAHYGRLTPISYAGKSYDSRHQFLCKCDCGNEVVVLEKHLRSGNTKSCGCYKRDMGHAANTTHGKSKTRLYRVWANMIERCESEDCPNYHRYGGRGIRVCNEWHDYSKFDEWAVFAGYNPSAKYGECTIDRIDVNGDYEPSNCRWITMKEQTDNRECTRRVEFNGECHTLKEWSEITGINYYTLHKRFRRGESPESILHIGKLPRKAVQ